MAIESDRDFIHAVIQMQIDGDIPTGRSVHVKANQRLVLIDGFDQTPDMNDLNAALETYNDRISQEAQDSANDLSAKQNFFNTVDDALAEIQSERNLISSDLAIIAGGASLLQLIPILNRVLLGLDRSRAREEQIIKAIRAMVRRDLE